MKYGVFGGTFDPPHLGHLAVAKAALSQLKLDEVILVPAARNPLRRTATLASPSKRLEMCTLLVSGEEGLSVSDIDVTRPPPSYAVDTLEELLRVMPGRYWFVVGSDSLQTIPQWHMAERLLRICRIAAVEREGRAMNAWFGSLPAWVTEQTDLIEMSRHLASSSKIRESILLGEPAQHWLKSNVWEYIEREKLYQKP